MRSLLVALLALTMESCLADKPCYREEYNLSHLHVVYLDHEQLLKEYEKMSNRDATWVHEPGAEVGIPPSRIPELQSIRGFFDYRTETIFCEKGDFEACGHELMHATCGHYHPEGNPAYP